MITLTNSFHGTSIQIRASEGATVTKATIQRVRKALCGINGCTCSGQDGTRDSLYSIAEIMPGRYQVMGPSEEQAARTYNMTGH